MHPRGTAAAFACPIVAPRRVRSDPCVASHGLRLVPETLTHPTPLDHVRRLRGYVLVGGPAAPSLRRSVVTATASFLLAYFSRPRKRKPRRGVRRSRCDAINLPTLRLRDRSRTGRQKKNGPCPPCEPIPGRGRPNGATKRPIPWLCIARAMSPAIGSSAAAGLLPLPPCRRGILELGSSLPRLPKLQLQHLQQTTMRCSDREHPLTLSESLNLIANPTFRKGSTIRNKSRFRRVHSGTYYILI